MDLSREPSADHRAAAAAMFAVYNALRLEGFSEYQSCTIIGTMLGTYGKGDSGNADG